MRLFRWMVTMAALLLLVPLANAEMKISGALSNQFRVEVPQGNDEEWDVGMALSTFDLIGRATNEERSARLFVNTDLRYDPTGVFEDDLEWRLREAYGGFYSDYFSFELGKRIYAWGMADEFNPTDLLNPEDMRWFVSVDKTDRKLGVFSANATLSYGGFSLQGVLVPVFEPTMLPAEDSRWLPWQLERLYTVINGFSQYVDYQPDDRPELNLGNAGYAAQFKGTIGPVDIAAVYFDGFDPLPTFAIDMNTDAAELLSGGKALFIRQEYQRYQAYGGGFALAVGSVSIRGEGAYYSPRYYLYDIDESLLDVDNDLAAYNALVSLEGHEWRVRKPSWSAAGGFDWHQGTQLYVNLQYVHTQLLDYEPGLVENENEGMVTMKLNTAWLEDDLQIGANGVYNVFHGDWWAKPYVRYNLTPDLLAEIGGQLYDGREETRFGEFAKNDFLYTLVKYSF